MVALDTLSQRYFTPADPRPFDDIEDRAGQVLIAGFGLVGGALRRRGLRAAAH